MTETHRTLGLRLLGRFSFTCDGVSLDLVYDKGRALLAYLALQPERVFARADLAALLWPDLARGTALANLRLVLHKLRPLINRVGAVDHPLLHIQRDTIALQVDARLGVDALDFLAPTPACACIEQPGFCAACLAEMARCAALYQGELLQGFDLPDCPDYSDWLSVQREVVLQRALVRLAQLADAYEGATVYADALPFAQRFLELDPWNEHGARRVLRLMASCGQRDAALAQYERWCRVVKSELGLMPSSETRMLAERIRHPALAQSGRRSTDSLQKIQPAPDSTAQLRLVTVLHCALEVEPDADPDSALTRLIGPQQRCCEIVRAFSGYLVQAHGGSLLAYFGYPLASENVARQAVRAGLTLRAETFDGVAVCISVHSGMVISARAPDVPDAIGSASGIAIRLRQLVNAGEVVISRATQRLVSGYFECKPLAHRLLAHTGSASEAFLVMQESSAKDRLEAAATLTPLTGRASEVAALLGLWQQVRQQGSPRSLLLQGDAGIGKSRMVLALKQALQDQCIAITELRCLPEYRQTPLHPLVALFHATLGFVPSDTPQLRERKLAQYVQAEYTNPKEQAEVHSLLTRLLSLPMPTHPGQVPATSPQQREKTLQIILDRLYAMAAPRPVLLVVEDLHWADPSSLELLHRILAHQRTGSWMGIFTSRPDFSPPWSSTQCGILRLEPLAAKDASALIEAAVPTLPSAVVRSIVERADGIPLFMEELAKEANDHDLASIPATLHDLLSTRLDALGPAKGIAQCAATLGRMFSLDSLHRIFPSEEGALTHALDQLCAAGVLQRLERSSFQFTHALVRDAAYQSQTRTERVAKHLRIASALESDREVRPELVAQHWSAGGKVREAVQCWVAASRLASLHSAHQEVILHCKAGLALLATLPEDAERGQMELDLQIKMGASLCATLGYTCAEGASAFGRAIALCAQHDEGSAEMFVAMWGLWASASLRVDYRHSLELAQQLQRMAESRGDPVQSQQAHFALGVTLFRQGHIRDAHTQFRHVQELYEPDQHAIHVASFGEDAGVANGSHLSGVLWFLGCADQSASTSVQAVAHARRLGHPYSLAYALAYAMLLHCHRREPAACLALADETTALAQRHDFALWQMGATLSRGWAMAQMGVQEGVEIMQQCVNATRTALGSVELMALAPLADACVKCGRAQAALAVIEEAFATGAAKADHHLDAELHRLRGEALLLQARENASAAGQCFETALAISREQHAKVFELRAATSLARLWQKKRKAHAAHALLSATYSSWHEGFGTPDLQAAHALLQSLKAR